jgi:ABC-type antimicrobial peptide transport system permease subunit
MFLVFGGVALFIAAVGLYGALSHAVSQRSREIGIRIALGATRWHVVAQIARRGALTIAAGTLVGLLLAAYSTRWLTDLLYETSPRDPIVFVVVGLVLAAAGLAAAIVPARRSARVDPLVVLKTE